jgi:hypothetical protein
MRLCGWWMIAGLRRFVRPCKVRAGHVAEMQWMENKFRNSNDQTERFEFDCCLDLPVTVSRIKPL